MRTLTILLALSFAGVLSKSYAKGAPACKKNLTQVSCNGVTGAKRLGFCWRGIPTESRKTKICKTKSKRKHKKTVMAY